MSTVAVETPVDLGALWRSLQVPVTIAVLALALVAVLAAVSTTNSSPLDPRSTSSTGTHALAVLLAERGVPVVVPATPADLVEAAKARQTVLLAEPGDLSDSVLNSLATTTATIVLIEPGPRELATFSVPASIGDEVTSGTPGPGCPARAAAVAGAIEFTGDLYAVRSGATGCYRVHADADSALVLSRRADGGRTVVLGGGALLTNADLGDSGNAALALGLLGQPPRLQWVPPGALGGALAPGDRRGLFSLLPRGLDWGLVQLAIALVVLALWRARRLGRPVVEPLPVVVRAAETIEGNARLLNAANARGTAASSLRAATRRRLAAMLRLGRDPDPVTLVSVVAEHTGASPDRVHGLLYGAEPPDDAQLVRVASGLPELEVAVRQDAGPTATTRTPTTTTTPGGHQ